jgi:hypothetical protein
MAVNRALRPLPVPAAMVSDRLRGSLGPSW